MGQVQRIEKNAFDDERRRCWASLPQSTDVAQWLWMIRNYGGRPNELSVKVGHPAAARSDRIGRSCARLFANRGKHVGSILCFGCASVVFPLVFWKEQVYAKFFFFNCFLFKLKKIRIFLMLLYMFLKLYNKSSNIQKY